MAIFFSILKIIGIILLCIIAFILMLILLVLIVPIRYNINGNKNAEKEELSASVIVSWLLHLVHIKLGYNNDKKLLLTIRILGIPFFKRNLLDKEISNSDKSNNSINNKWKESNQSFSDDTVVSAKELSDPDSGLYKIEELECSENQNPPDTADNDNNYDLPQNNTEDILNDTSDNCEESEEFNKKDSLLKRIFDFYNFISNKLKSLFSDMQQKIADIENKFNNINSSYNFYKRFIEDEHNQLAIKRCIAELKRVLKSVLPRKVKGYIHFGMDDPSTTGQILSYISLMYPFLGDKIQFEADFNNKIIEGYLKIRGKITAFVLLVAAWRIYFSKDIKRFIRIYKKHKIKVSNS